MVALRESISAILDGSGRGSVRLGPAVYGDVWHITKMTTNGNSTVDPTFKVYRGAESDTTMVDNSLGGNADTSDDVNMELLDGDYLTGVWTKGTSGAIMSFRVEGEKSRRI